MKFKIIKYALLLVSLSLVFCLLLCACSPTKRLRRLVRLHPELLQRDTIYQLQSVSVPEIKHDTFIKIEKDTTGLTKLLNQYKQAKDGSEQIAVIEKIVDHYQSIPLIKGIFSIRLPDNGYILLWQQGSTLRHKVYIPKRTVSEKRPVAITNTYKDIPWRLPWWWLIVTFVCGIALVLIFRKK